MEGLVAEMLRTQRHEQGYLRGARRVRIEDLLLVLEIYGITLTPGERARITSCDDDILLDRWFERALTASTVHNVFDGNPRPTEA
ncbi:hypothetical protein [Streptomyces boncukensis]|uniref:Uncharacterized protein n=1 Tax=Streptomyces boncukensis TaxID=2711219 RepID=A0A6G4WZS8_9ACTN|nr:hypothetical protein [Streptomyces boncukensis]NGO70745.1 hypothetical protein [Streptomyces boncukensis]